jgi:peptidoglycan/xylan/chitin deacetylase (PgdA/CDA1 family)
MASERRTFLKQAGLTGAAIGISRLGVHGEPFQEGAAAQAPKPAPHKMFAPDPDAERLVREFPAKGVTRMALPYPQRRGAIKFPGDKKIAAVVSLALDYVIYPQVEREGAIFKMDYWNFSEFSEYPYTIGGWRALDVLAKNGVKATVLATGFGTLKYPDLHKECQKAGHEIAAYGWDSGTPSVMYTAEQEAAMIAETTKQVSDTVGVRPKGWITPQVLCTERTFGLLADAGYQWNGDLRDDDIPYAMKVGSKTLIQIPFRTMTTDDHGIWGAGRSRIGFDPETAVAYYKSVLDMYVESAELAYPLLLMFGIHPTAGCLPDRVRGVDKILAMLKAHPKVWLTNYGEVADYWAKQYA